MGIITHFGCVNPLWENTPPLTFSSHSFYSLVESKVDFKVLVVPFTFVLVVVDAVVHCF